jgi:hypothetical protein
MVAPKFRALFVLGILSFPSFATVSPCRQEGKSEDTGEPKVTLANALPRLAKTCGCFFTLEEAWRNGESTNAMEEAFIPERILGHSLRKPWISLLSWSQTLLMP